MMGSEPNPKGVSALTSRPVGEAQTGDLNIWPLKDIKEPHENDVLYGRGGGTNHHLGNIKYRKNVQNVQQHYTNASRTEKGNIARNLVLSWRTRNDPPGRFLIMNKNGRWDDVGDNNAKEKTCQLFRECRRKDDSKSRRLAAGKQKDPMETTAKFIIAEGSEKSIGTWESASRKKFLRDGGSLQLVEGFRFSKESLGSIASNEHDVSIAEELTSQRTQSPKGIRTSDLSEQSLSKTYDVPTIVTSARGQEKRDSWLRNNDAKNFAELRDEQQCITMKTMGPPQSLLGPSSEQERPAIKYSGFSLTSEFSMPDISMVDHAAASSLSLMSWCSSTQPSTSPSPTNNLQYPTPPISARSDQQQTKREPCRLENETVPRSAMKRNISFENEYEGGVNVGPSFKRSSSPKKAAINPSENVLKEIPQQNVEETVQGDVDMLRNNFQQSTLISNDESQSRHNLRILLSRLYSQDIGEREKAAIETVGSLAGFDMEIDNSKS